MEKKSQIQLLIFLKFCTGVFELLSPSLKDTRNINTFQTELNIPVCVLFRRWSREQPGIWYSSSRARWQRCKLLITCVKGANVASIASNKSFLKPQWLKYRLLQRRLKSFSEFQVARLRLKCGEDRAKASSGYGKIKTSRLLRKAEEEVVIAWFGVLILWKRSSGGLYPTERSEYNCLWLSQRFPLIIHALLLRLYISESAFITQREDNKTQTQNQARNRMWKFTFLKSLSNYIRGAFLCKTFPQWLSVHNAWNLPCGSQWHIPSPSTASLFQREKRNQ